MRWLILCALLATPAAAAPVEVVASFPILADMVREVGGERVAVTSLVPPGGDVHVYQPTPQDAGRVAQADLVVVNGLGFEGWLERLVEAAEAGRVVEAAAGVTPIPAEEDGDEAHAAEGHDADAAEAHAEEEAHGAEEHAAEAHEAEALAATAHDEDVHGAFDPHAWQDVGNARRYVATIAAALAEADPDGAAAYAANAARYDAELAALDAEIVAALAPLGERRVLVSHDALGYFEQRYGIAFVAAQGLSTEAEPSARDVAALIREVRGERVDAVFVEAQADRRMVERIAAETGARVGEALYVDTLSDPDGPAPTYVAMMRHNVGALTKALGRAER